MMFKKTALLLAVLPTVQASDAMWSGAAPYGGSFEESTTNSGGNGGTWGGSAATTTKAPTAAPTAEPTPAPTTTTAAPTAAPTTTTTMAAKTTAAPAAQTTESKETTDSDLPNRGGDGMGGPVVNGPEDKFQMPAWAWWLIGLTGVAIVGAIVAYAMGAFGPKKAPKKKRAVIEGRNVVEPAPEAEQPVDDGTCKFCGNVFMDDSNFCRKCGHNRYDGHMAPVPTRAQTISMAQPVAQSVAQPMMQPMQPVVQSVYQTPAQMTYAQPAGVAYPAGVPLM